MYVGVTRDVKQDGRVQPWLVRRLSLVPAPDIVDKI